MTKGSTETHSVLHSNQQYQDMNHPTSVGRGIADRITRVNADHYASRCSAYTVPLVREVHAARNEVQEPPLSLGVDDTEVCDTLR